MDLQTRLYERAKAEQERFISDLKLKSPEEIINSSYEKVIRDDILTIFENDKLPKEQVKELLKLKEPLGACYARWLYNDYSHMDMLRDTIDELADELLKYNKEQKKTKKKQEPER
jgi:regulator of RNase E activity RraB